MIKQLAKSFLFVWSLVKWVVDTVIESIAYKLLSHVAD